MYKLVLVNPAEIESSEWEMDDDKIVEYSIMDSPIPPIVIDRSGSIVDGGHRLESAKNRGLPHIKVFRQV